MGTRIIGWVLLSAALSTGLLGCAARGSAAKQNRTPRVLIIGDSISIGYFEPTKQLLAGKADVYHNAGNAGHTRNGLAQLDTWLGDTQWDVIHFNHGLHDLKYVNAKGALVPPDQGTQVMSVDEYARNLEQIVKRLKQTRARLIFATTTPVPDGAAGRIKGDVERYNRAALAIMQRYGVRVNDLYAFALPRLSSIQQPSNVHFTEAGSRLLAQQVANSILAALPK
ncbi:MAG: SGNH/GDSL hydrolase family protein [Planctomycetes bacterium]|nr:SGNH/GDSL hydrolase family protein [Planctomycetota bacterium]